MHSPLHTFSVQSNCIPYTLPSLLRMDCARFTLLTQSRPAVTLSSYGFPGYNTIQPPGPVTCIDFSDIVVNDDVALEGDENFTIFIQLKGAVFAMPR